MPPPSEEPVIRLPISLRQPPQILQMGIGVHGKVRRERYNMHDLWCVHLYRYDATLRINGEVFPIHPGSISVTPPDAELEYLYRGRSVHAYAHFKMEREGKEELIPAMQNLGNDFTVLNHDFEQAVGCFSTQPARATARLWDILWQLVEYAQTPGTKGAPETHGHPIVAEARKMIELCLSEPIGVASLARQLGISHNHLTRLFQADINTSVVGYIRQRRMEHAQHLLTQTTLPMKVIAAQIGMHDLHALNKTVRRQFGVSPRALRHSKQEQ